MKEVTDCKHLDFILVAETQGTYKIGVEHTKTKFHKLNWLGRTVWDRDKTENIIIIIVNLYKMLCMTLQVQKN